jgi:hypothetical protein
LDGVTKQETGEGRQGSLFTLTFPRNIDGDQIAVGESPSLVKNSVQVAS